MSLAMRAIMLRDIEGVRQQEDAVPKALAVNSDPAALNGHQDAVVADARGKAHLEGTSVEDEDGREVQHDIGRGACEKVFAKGRRSFERSRRIVYENGLPKDAKGPLDRIYWPAFNRHCA